MSKVAQVQFAPWDKVYDFSVSQAEVAAGDDVIVKTELGTELGRVLSVKEALATTNGPAEDERKLKPIIRKAELADISQLATTERQTEALRLCREFAKKHGLTMKIVDVYISWSGERYNFAFTAEGRIDFRELVKDLAGRLGGNIRLTQIGARDEARLFGLCGACGRELCCRNVLKGFCSITSEMAEAQQLNHRGSDRISGICGRLKCCLAFEYEGYKELDGQLPPLGTRVKCGSVRGTVVEHHILKQTLGVRIPAERPDERPPVIEFPLAQLKYEK